MTDASGNWELGRVETQSARTSADDLVMVVPSAAGVSPTLRAFEHLQGDIVTPGIIERAKGHDLPDIASVEWDDGTVPPVLILSPLTFDSLIQSGMTVGIELTGFGGGGGQQPSVTVDLRDPDNNVVSTVESVTANMEPEFLLLDLTNAAPVPSVSLNIEATGGSSSGAIEFHVNDILGFTGSSRAAQLIALIASQLLTLENDMGMTQAEVLNLLNTLIPPGQRIPVVKGHAMQLPVVNDAGTAIVLKSFDDAAGNSDLEGLVTQLGESAVAGIHNEAYARSTATTLGAGTGTLVGSTRVIDPDTYAIVCEFEVWNASSEEVTTYVEVLIDEIDYRTSALEITSVTVPAGGRIRGSIFAQYDFDRSNSRVIARAWHNRAAGDFQTITGLLAAYRTS